MLLVRHNGSKLSKKVSFEFKANFYWALQNDFWSFENFVNLFNYSVWLQFCEMRLFKIISTTVISRAFSIPFRKKNPSRYLVSIWVDIGLAKVFPNASFVVRKPFSQALDSWSVKSFDKLCLLLLSSLPMQQWCSFGCSSTLWLTCQNRLFLLKRT